MRTFRIAVALLVAAAAALPGTANAWWRGGLWIGVAPVVPFYYPPPVVYAPPPVFYAPPPVVYDPNAAAAAAAAAPARRLAPSGSCGAGAYVCPLDEPLAPGTPCSCPANRGRVSGYAR
jgi:hypothetical protein